MKTLVICDSSNPVPHNRMTRSVFQILDHMGMLYESVDLSWSRVSDPDLTSVHLVVMGQEGITKSVSGDEMSALMKRVSQGMGLAILDGYVKWYPRDFLSGLRLGEFAEQSTTAVRTVPEHWICGSAAEPEVVLNRPVPCYGFRDLPPGWHPFLVSERGDAIGLAAAIGKGRLVLFAVSAGIWQNEYLGHTAGLDGVFWRSLVWAARKPFATKAMPPFVTARIDDVSGSGNRHAKHPDTTSRLAWLNALNRGGFLPNVGLFVRDIAPSDVPAVRQAHYDGQAEFSAHAFRDGNDDDSRIYAGAGGAEFSPDLLRSRFEELDRLFSEWAVHPSRTLNAHYGQIGLSALPFLKERNQTYLMNIRRVGRSARDPKASEWELKPYGRSNFSLDTVPEDPAFFNAASHPYLKGASGRTTVDFLSGCTTFGGETSGPDLPQALRRGVFQIRRGLENLFFGCLMTHEQRIGHLSLQEWETVVARILEELKGFPHLFRSYDYISAYAENRSRWRIVRAEYREELVLWLGGTNRMPQLLPLFLDDNGTIRQTFLEIPSFDRFVTLNFRV